MALTCFVNTLEGQTWRGSANAGGAKGISCSSGARHWSAGAHHGEHAAPPVSAPQLGHSSPASAHWKLHQHPGPSAEQTHASALAPYVPQWGAPGSRP
jgi:hypothetical protein